MSRWLWVAGCALVGSGCATTSPDTGLASVQAITATRGADVVRQVRSEEDAALIQNETRERLTNALSVDDAVQIAMLNNRALQATYAELDMAQAEVLQASRLSNPTWTYRHAGRGDALSVESVLTFQVIELLTLPLRGRIEAQRFEETKLTVADAVLRVAADTRIAYFEAVAAQQSVRYHEQVRDAAAAGAELARGMVEAGNWPKVAYMREQLFAAETATQLARARQKAVAARERLTRLMGLWGAETEFKLPDRLPALPEDVAVVDAFESQAIADRLDVRAARLHTERLASHLGLSRATRFINVLELGAAWVKDAPEPGRRGYEISLSVPLFDWGDARVAKAEATYMQAVHQLAALAVQGRSQLREAYSAYRTTHELAKRYRDEIVPLRKRIADENVLRYNAMLISVFELLAEAREQVLAVDASIEALKDFWIAETELRQAVGGRLAPAAPAPAAPAPAAPAPAPAKDNR